MNKVSEFVLQFCLRDRFTRSASAVALGALQGRQTNRFLEWSRISLRY